MSMFQEGDRVRALKGIEDGLVKSILPKGKILVVWDDFDEEEEVSAKEIVLIHSGEDLHFGGKNRSQRNAPEEELIVVKRDVGSQFLAICLAGNVDTHEIWMVNPANFEINFNLYLKIKGKLVAFKNGKASPAARLLLGKIGETEFNKLSGIIFQSISWSDSGNMKPKLPVHLELRLDNKMGRERIPELDRDGIRLDLKEPVEEVVVPISKPIIKSTGPPPEEVDLHIDMIVDDPSKLDPAAMLDVQVRHFENMLDRAISHNMKKIIFIHGIGKGALRLEVLRRLDNHEFVQKHQPASLLRYGNGAVEVWLE